MGTLRPVLKTSTTAVCEDEPPAKQWIVRGNYVGAIQLYNMVQFQNVLLKKPVGTLESMYMVWQESFTYTLSMRRWLCWRTRTETSCCRCTVLSRATLKESIWQRLACTVWSWRLHNMLRCGAWDTVWHYTEQTWPYDLILCFFGSNYEKECTSGAAYTLITTGVDESPDFL